VNEFWQRKRINEEISSVLRDVLIKQVMLTKPPTITMIIDPISNI